MFNPATTVYDTNVLSMHILPTLTSQFERNRFRGNTTLQWRYYTLGERINKKLHKYQNKYSLDWKQLNSWKEGLRRSINRVERYVLNWFIRHVILAGQQFRADDELLPFKNTKKTIAQHCKKRQICFV